MRIGSPGAFSIPHNHNAFELRLVQGGNGVILADGARFPVRDGDLFITPPLTYHCFLPEDNSAVSYLSIRFSLQPGERHAEVYESALARLSVPLLLRTDDDWAARLLVRMDREFRDCRPGYMSRVGALSTSLILTVLQALFPDANLRWNDACEAYDIHRETQIEQFFSQRFREDVSIADLASELFVSTRQTNRILYGLYRCSFSEKLLATRLENVRVRLHGSGSSVSEIASSCGFRTMSYFYTAFRRYFGCSPSELK